MQTRSKTDITEKPEDEISREVEENVTSLKIITNELGEKFLKVNGSLYLPLLGAPVLPKTFAHGYSAAGGLFSQSPTPSSSSSSSSSPSSSSSSSRHEIALAGAQVPDENRLALEGYSPLNATQERAYERGIDLLNFSGSDLAGLFFYGTAGTGKTQLAMHIAALAKQRGLRVFHVSEITLSKVMASEAKFPSEFPKFIDKYDLFIFDDMNGVTEHCEIDLFNCFIPLVHSAGNKKIIITSNNSYDAFISRNFVDLKTMEAKEVDRQVIYISKNAATPEKLKLLSRFQAAIRPESSVIQFAGTDLRLTRRGF